MLFFFLTTIILILWGIKISVKGFNDEYLSKGTTIAIKGLFVLIVFFSHFKSYVILDSQWWNSSFQFIINSIGQLMVVMFIFYSGYGIVMQIEKSKDEYIKSFLQHRFLPVYLQFLICIGLYLIVDVALGLLSKYSLLNILLSFTGWTSIGNSNWFMFVTFILYLFIFLSFRFIKFKDIKWNILIFSILSIVLLIVLYLFKESYWWNTLLCLALGMWYGYYKDGIESFMRIPKKYWLVTIPLLLVFFVLWFIYLKIWSSGYVYIILSFLFALSVVVITMKVQIGNKILDFFGKHVFSIYILQRIPMIVFKGIINNIYLYFVVSFAITTIIAVVFDYVFNKVKFLLKSKRKFQCNN